MTDRELLQQALDAYNKFDYSRFPTVKALENAMLAICTRLAQPEPEPIDLIENLPKGTTHLSVRNFREKSGGVLAVEFHAFKYEKDLLLAYDTCEYNAHPQWIHADKWFQPRPNIFPIYAIYKGQ